MSSNGEREERATVAASVCCAAFAVALPKTAQGRSVFRSQTWDNNCIYWRMNLLRTNSVNRKI